MSNEDFVPGQLVIAIKPGGPIQEGTTCRVLSYTKLENTKFYNITVSLVSGSEWTWRSECFTDYERYRHNKDFENRMKKVIE